MFKKIISLNEAFRERVKPVKWEVGVTGITFILWNVSFYHGTNIARLEHPSWFDFSMAWLCGILGVVGIISTVAIWINYWDQQNKKDKESRY